MTNSAGRTGATPMRQIRRPLSRSLRVIADRARPPQQKAVSWEEAEAVDALRVQHFLLRLVDPLLKVDSQAHNFVGGSLEDGMIVVVARIDASDRPARRQVQAVPAC